MNIRPEDTAPDFNALADYLRAELNRNAADERAIHLASEQSFAKWAHGVLEHLAQRLGVTIGYLVGLAAGAYDSIKGGLAKGFAEGFARGRGR